jgi:hypothetical protein
MILGYTYLAHDQRWVFFIYISGDVYPRTLRKHTGLYHNPFTQYLGLQPLPHNLEIQQNAVFLFRNVSSLHPHMYTLTFWEKHNIIYHTNVLQAHLEGIHLKEYISEGRHLRRCIHLYVSNIEEFSYLQINSCSYCQGVQH